MKTKHLINATLIYITAILVVILTASTVKADAGWASDLGYTDTYSYPDCGMVTEIATVNDDDPDTANFLITFITQNGNIFSFYSDDGDWYEGDLVAVLFLTLGTTSVLDDAVIDSKYVGYLSATEMELWVKYPTQSAKTDSMLSTQTSNTAQSNRNQ